MKRTILCAIALALTAAAAWGDGDAIRYDPNTGVILPAGRTPAVVERQTLEIEFQPYPRPSKADGREASPGIRMVKVRAQYWLRNPGDKPLDLKIGFPVPGGGIELVEPPVRVDGQLGDWRLLSYEDLARPMQPSLIRAMQRWADRHPEAIRLAGQIRALYASRTPYEQRRKQVEVLGQQLRAELVKAGVAAPVRNPYGPLHSSLDAARAYQDIWTLRSALLVTGQRNLLPEGRWYVDPTVLDAVTGRPVLPRDELYQTVSMLTFPLHLEAGGRRQLQVLYRQLPSRGEDTGWNFAYILRTTRAWDSFGPIETTVKAPAGLTFRSLPVLRYAGMSAGLKVYRGTLVNPRRNLQIALATREDLRPKLKVNGQLRGGRVDLLVNGRPTVPLAVLRYPWLSPLDATRFERGELTLRRGTTVLRARPGEKRMFVNERPVALRTPIVVREGRTYLPVEALQALYPTSEITLTYDAPSRTVLFSAKPKPKAPEAPRPGNGGTQ